MALRLMGTKMKTAAAYIRVSTEDQVEFSPDSQLKRIREYAGHNDIVLLEDHIYVDEGISGKQTKHREAFNRMIGMAKTKPKPFDVILVWKFSRFARNREDSIVYKSMLRKQCDIQVVSISESLGDDKTSILIEALIEAMDEYYSINLAEEVKRGMTEKASRGGIVAAPPVGYRIEGGRYVPDDNAPLIRDMFTDFVNGAGYRQLANKYAGLGLRTTRGNKPDNRFVEYVIRNPVYTGKIRWCADGRGASRRDFDNPGNIIVDGEHEAIISKEIWNKAQERVRDIKHKYGKYQRPEQACDFMLKGLLRCSNCGATLTHLSTKCPSVQCHNYARGSCTVSHSLSISKANRAVIDGLRDAVETLSFRFDPDKIESPQKDFEKLLAREEAKLERAKAAYLNGIDTVEEYGKAKSNIQKNIDAIKAEAAKAKASDDKLEIDATAFSASVQDVLDVLESDCSEKEKNDALRSVISYIVYDKPNQNLVIYFAP